LSLATALCAGCQHDLGIESFEFERDTPGWLKVRIEAMAVDPYYAGTVVYRHEWKGMFVYHVDIPLSSCAYCEVYDQAGNRIQFASDGALQDYLTNRRNELVVWHQRVVL
jgi:hypothetical protein